MRKIIVLYGPPGVGKLTVAKELSKKTKFKIFHNHLVSDLLSNFFDFGTEEFAEKFSYLWTYLFKEILKNKDEGLIITLVYGLQTLEGKNDKDFFLKIKNKGEKNESEVFFVKLECSEEEIKKRIVSKSRKKYKKLTSPFALEKIRKKYNIDNKVPFLESIVIDTTKMNPSQVAKKILTVI